MLYYTQYRYATMSYQCADTAITQRRIAPQYESVFAQYRDITVSHCTARAQISNCTAIPLYHSVALRRDTTIPQCRIAPPYHCTTVSQTLDQQGRGVTPATQ